MIIYCRDFSNINRMIKSGFTIWEGGAFVKFKHLILPIKWKTIKNKLNEQIVLNVFSFSASCIPRNGTGLDIWVWAPVYGGSVSGEHLRTNFESHSIQVYLTGSLLHQTVKQKSKWLDKSNEKCFECIKEKNSPSIIENFPPLGSLTETLV